MESLPIYKQMLLKSYDEIDISEMKYEFEWDSEETRYLTSEELNKKMNVGDVWFDYRTMTINIKVKTHYVYDCDLERVCFSCDNYNQNPTWQESWYDHMTLKNWFSEDIAKKFKYVFEKEKDSIVGLLIEKLPSYYPIQQSEIVKAYRLVDEKI